MTTYCLNFSLLQNDLFFLILNTEVDKVRPSDFCLTSSFLEAGAEAGGGCIIRWLGSKNWPHFTFPLSKSDLNLDLFSNSKDRDSSVLGKILGSELSLNKGGGSLRPPPLILEGETGREVCRGLVCLLI